METKDNIIESYIQLAVRISLDEVSNLQGSGVLLLGKEGTEAYVLTAYHVVTDFMKVCESCSIDEEHRLLCHVNLTDGPKEFSVSQNETDRILKHDKAEYIVYEKCPEDNKLENDAAIIRIPYQKWMNGLPRFQIQECNLEKPQIGWGYPESQLKEGISGRSKREGTVVDKVNADSWFVKFQYNPNTVGCEGNRESINKGFSGAGIFQKYTDRLVLSGIISGGVGAWEAGAEMKLARSRLFLEILEKNHLQILSSVKTNRYTDDPEYMEKWFGRPSLYPQNSKLLLKDMFSLPDYRYRSDNQGTRHPGKMLEERLLGVIQANTDRNYKRMYVVVGNPGAGKSSLLRYLWHHPKLKEDSICYFSGRNLSDKFSESARSEDMVKTFYAIVKQSFPEVSPNTTIFFDGFDELNLSRDKAHKFMSALYNDLVSSKRVRCIIVSCRTNFEGAVKSSGITSIVLLPFNKEQILQYIAKWGISLSPDLITDTLEKIYGIPLILQIALASGLDLTERESLATVYYKLLNPKSGIFTRKILNLLEEEDQKIQAYGSEQPHKAIWELAEDICKVNEELAFWMFENNPGKMVCKKEKVDEIIKSVNEDLRDQQLLIGSFYQELVEGNNNISFIHSSIYEYFVAHHIYRKLETLFSDMENISYKAFCVQLVSDSGDCSAEESFMQISQLFYRGKMSELTRLFLKKIIEYQDKKTQKKSSSCQNRVLCWGKLLEKGMEKGLAPVKDNQPYVFPELIRREYNVFWNLLEITQILYDLSGFHKKNSQKIKRLFDDSLKIKKSLPDYIIQPYDKNNQYLNFSHFNLDEICLVKANLTDCILNNCSMKKAGLRKIYLNLSKLEDSDLSEANLFMANLEAAKMDGAKLIGADMEKAYLSEASLVETDFSSANLKNADLSDANCRGAKFIGCDLRGAKMYRTNLSDCHLTDCKMNDAQFEDSEKNSVWDYNFAEAEFDRILVDGEAYTYKAVVEKQKENMLSENDMMDEEYQEDDDVSEE